ncbi:MAG: tRNA (adenosine(37)-N6)-threonylcarbamoyltransferase complex ATPase subunit type 1 TsaE [Candidatus Altimarinota bacterium]
MQEATNFPLDIGIILREDEIIKYTFPLLKGNRVYFRGDLGSGKSTFIRTLLREHFGNPTLVVRSPTYTYFEKYGENIYHFDLYRLESINDFFLIGGSDIFDNPSTICLIEWPDVISSEYKPTLEVNIEKLSDTQRRFTFHSHRESIE